jgi:hypothetical protein
MSHIEHRAKQCVKISLNENNHITHIARDKFNAEVVNKNKNAHNYEKNPIMTKSFVFL